MIEIKNITKKYGNQIALNNISFKIKKGEIVGFLGPNGAGKSTMMKIINSYISADDGNIIVDNINISDNPKKIKKNIGYLPENNPLYTEMYVREYLEYVANIYKLSHAEIEKVIELTGLSSEANKKISQLSKGYKQRVGLAAAIIHNPDYLILDEPTTGLDPNQILEIRNLIKDYGKNKTVLLSTHIMQEVEAMCDRVIIVNKGELVADKMLSDFTTSEGDFCKVVFRNEIDINLIEQLVDVKTVKTNNNKNFEIQFTNQSILTDLVSLVSEKDNDIIEFKISEKRLEDIFRELTT
jgi:ABC-2 type transport system ATP-binding protein